MASNSRKDRMNLLDIIVSGFMRKNFIKHSPNIVIYTIKMFYDDDLRWDTDNLVDGLNVLKDEITVNNISNKKRSYWCCAVSVAIYKSGEQSFKIKVLKDPKKEWNTWRIMIGVVPVDNIHFDSVNIWDRYFCGKHFGGWAYIADGLKSHSACTGTQYGAKYTVNDVIKCQLNFDKKSIQFYKNNTSQGIAFNDLNVPVRIAVGMAIDGASLKIVNQ